MKSITSSRFVAVPIFFVLSLVCALVLAGAVSSKAPGDLEVVRTPEAIRMFDVGSGAHTLNFQLGRETKTQYLGASPLRQAMQSEQVEPRTMVSDDFNGDGMGDLVIGYANNGGGVLGLRLGNLQAIAPTDAEVFEGVQHGRYPSPFLTEVSLYSLPEAPDFLHVGDFNSDGYSDVLAAARGGQSMYLFAGDGRGHLGAPTAFDLPGLLTAMQAGREQLGKFTSLAVGLLTANGPKLDIYNEPIKGLSGAPDTYTISGEVTALAVGDLNQDGTPDVAAAAGNEVAVAYQPENIPVGVSAETKDNTGTLEASSRSLVPLEITTFPFAIKGLAIGNFVFDRGHQTELALLADDGAVHLADRGVPDRRAFSQQDIDFIQKQHSAFVKDQQNMESLTREMNKLVRRSSSSPQSEWRVTETLRTGVAPSYSGGSGLLKSARMSGLALDDLLVGNATDNSVQVVKNKQDILKMKLRNGDALGETTSVHLEGAPLAAVSMRLCINGLPGMVVLHAGQSEPTLSITSPNAVFVVNTTLDQIDLTQGNGVCNSASGCSLRAAITESNFVGGSNAITVPNGTYTLTLGPWDDEFNTLGANMDSGDLDVIDLSFGGFPLLTSVTINGAGRDTTIIQMGTLSPGAGGITKDRVIESNNFVIPQHGTGLTLNNLTIQNGNAPRTPDPDHYNTKGGGIQFDGFDSPSSMNSGVLTITNCKFTGNTSAGQGGGIFGLFGDLTVQSNSIVSSNTTTFAAGAGIQHSGGNDVTTTFNIINSTIGGALPADGNTAGDSTFGSGGGVDSVGALAFNINTGTVIRNNTGGIASGGNGGGGVHIGNSKNIVFSNSTISDNKCKHNGGGIWVSARDAVTNAASTITLTTMNVTGNQADSDNTLVGDGGGIYTFFGTAIVQTTSHIDGNSAVNGGGIFTGWSGIAADPTAGLTVQSNSTIGQAGAGNGNSAKNNGGSICINPGAATTFGPINLNSLTFTNNTANSDNSNGGDGGAIFVGNGNLTSLNACTIDGNVANSGTGDGIRQSGGTITGAGTVNVNGGDSISLSGGTFTSTPATLNITGNLLNSGGNFVHNSGTVVFNGSAAQTIGGTTPMTFNNLTIDNATGVNLGASETVAGTLTLTSGLLGVVTNTLTLNGPVSFTGGSITSGATGTVNYNKSSNVQNISPGNYGNLTLSNFTKTLPSGLIVRIAGTFAAGAAGGHTLTGSTVEFNGTGAQTLPSNFTTYNNLTLNNAAGVTGFAGLTVQALLRIQAGTFTSSSTYKDVQIDNLATLAGTNATTINVSGSWTNNGTFTANGNTVNFNGSATQALGGSSTTIFNNLTINNATGVTLGNNATVGGALTLTAGALGVGTNTLTLNGAVSATGGSLTSGGTGTIIYNQGSGGQAVLALNYGNLTFSNFNKTLASSGTIGIAGTFTPGSATGHTITGSTIDFNGGGPQTIPAFNYNNLTSSSSGARTLASTGNIRIAALFTPGANTYTITGSTIEYNGASAQTLPAGFVTYNNLTLNNTAGTTGFAGLTVQALLRVQAGTFTSSSTYNNVQIDSGATLAASAGSTINVSGNWTNNGAFTANNGTVNFNGSSAQSIGGSSTTTFNNLTINNAAGVSLSADIAINATLTLQAGPLAIGSRTLTLNNAISITSGSFTSNANGTVNYNQSSNGQNVAPGNYGNLTFSNFQKTLPSSGTVKIAGTFATGAGGGHTLTGSTVEFNGAGAQTLPSNFTTYNNLTLNNTAGVTGFAGLIVQTLMRVQAGAFTTSSSFKDVQIDMGATLAAIAASTINISGSWTNNGTFTANTGTVNFNGVAAQTMSGASTTTFNNLTINNAAGVGLSANETVNGALTLTSGALIVGTQTLTLNGAVTATGGSITSSATGTVSYNQGSNGQAVLAANYGNLTFSNFTKTLPSTGAVRIAGAFTTGAAGGHTVTGSTVEYNGASAQSMPSGFTVYNNLTINNAAGVSLGADATANGILALTSGDLITGSFTLTQPNTGSSAGTTDVVGNVKRTGFVSGGSRLTFGNPFNSIQINSGTAPTDITVNLVKAAPTSPPFAAAITRTYTVTPNGGSGLSATLRLHYQDSDLNGNAEGAGLNLFRFDGSSWHNEGQTANDTTDNWVEKSGVSQFSPWTLNSTVPTEAKLESFTATGYDKGVLIEWKTGFEVDNLGFNIYREESGKRVLVNPQMVAGSALVAGSGVVMRAGQSYAWWDKGISDCGLPTADCRSAQYWLESVDLNGKSEWHGPFSSKYIAGDAPVRGNSSFLDRIGNAQIGLTAPIERAALLQKLKPEQIKLQSDLASQAAVKMWVKREGFYKVTASELAAAGLDPRADTRLLQLYADGQQIPINIVSDKDGLLSAVEFYGRGLDAAFTDQRVYWLVSGTEPGLRIDHLKGAGQPTVAQSFLYTVERKDHSIYFSALRNGESENFFGAVIASSPVDQSVSLQHLDQSATGAATVEVALQGVTKVSHKVWIYVNEAFAGEAAFDGQTQAISRLTVAQTLLKSGENQVRFVAQAGPSDISLVDYIRLSYWHNFTADDDALGFTTAGNQEVTIDGFTNGAIRVLDVTDPDSVQELVTKIEKQKNVYAATVASPGAGERRLQAMTDEQSRKPVTMAANQPSSWRTTAHAADLVMIARREFFSAIEPLRALRSSQGMKVELVDVEDVYDEFSNGNKSPQAVKDLLQYATTSWKAKPRYLLLVGDASYDGKNYLGLGDWDLVPTRLIDTSLMETASDDWLADFNGDGIADLAVGRLAARTPDEASVMVRKIIGYESSEPLESMLLVADINNGYNFESAATELRDLIPQNLRIEQINRGQLGDATAKSRLMEGIMRGQKVVNYLGHGSVNLWSGGLLTNEDARNLTNGERLPVFVMMTCLNGYFHDPGLDSLAETLVKAENGGAVAAWTSTGLTVPAEQSLLNQELYRLLFTANAQGRAMTLGDATTRAKAAVNDKDIRRTWVLLGDPTMRLR